MKTVELGKCPTCGARIPTHVVCPSCGHYMGRPMIEIED
jgi:large subunit ribosomal protein L32